MRNIIRTVVFIGALLGGHAYGDSDPNVSRGIAPGKTYREFDIDTVNDFTGNLILRIPISELPVGPKLVQRLELTYNSTIYDYEFVEDYDPVQQKKYFRRAIPENFSNGGLGWLLTLGQLVKPKAATQTTPARGYFYRAADGSEHDFAPDTSQFLEATTRDGSYMRLRRYPQNLAVNVDYWEVESSDGLVHKFDADGNLLQIRDDNGYTIELEVQHEAESSPRRWLIRSKYNGVAFRTVTITFVKRTAPAGKTYADDRAWVIGSIDVPAFGGTTATYTFAHDDVVLPRDGCGDEVPNDPVDFAAPLLRTVTMPGGLVYTFNYETQQATECATGLMLSAAMPAGGTIEWEWARYSRAMANCTLEHGWLVDAPGVGTRTVKDASGGLIGTWTYATDINIQPGTTVACNGIGNFNLGPAPTLVTTSVTAPDGSTTKRYYSGLMNGARATGLNAASNRGYTIAEYGLPFTRDPVTNDQGVVINPHPSYANRYLSSETRDAYGRLVRARYVTYEGDGLDHSGRLANPRVQGELTVFSRDLGCNGECLMDVDRAAYDGYGNYRRSTSTSNFGPTRVTHTNYTPDPVRWRFGTYDSLWIQENGVTRKELFTFDDRDMLKTRRRLRATAATADLIAPDDHGDVLEAYCRDERGYLKSERFFGGDERSWPLPDFDPCTADTGNNEYRLNHTYVLSNGVPTRHTAQYAGVPFLTVDEDLDANTGLLKASRDPAGVETTYTFDALGRIVEIVPSGTPWTRYEYTIAAAGAPARLRIATRAAGTRETAATLTDTYIYYDALGRVSQQKSRQRTSDGTRWSATKTTYDALGRVLQTSVPEFRLSSAYEAGFAPAHATTTSYDVFGRATSVTAADGTTTTITHTGQGVREIATTASSALWENGAIVSRDVTSTAVYDHRDRLRKITEGNGTATIYTYDGDDRLTRVCQGASGDGTLCGQQRTFSYDGRGFLRNERHPESDVAWYWYDAKGNPIRRRRSETEVGAGDLKWSYDAAERPLSIYFNDGTEFKLGKFFEYDARPGDALGNRANGRLRSATRFNYISGGTVAVTERHEYDDTAGRRTKTTTDINRDGVLLKSVEQGQTYDASGGVRTLRYPACALCGSAPWDLVTNSYANGMLTAVSGFADSIEYAAGGAVAVIDHAGPVVDRYTQDQTGMRTKTIAFEGFGDCQPPVIDGATPYDQSVQAGTAASLTVDAADATGFQWFRGDGTRVDGATSATYTTPAVTATASYYVEAYNGCGTVRSRTATVRVCSDLTHDATTPRDQSIAPDQQVTLSVEGSNATRYQWYRGNGSAIAGATQASYTPAPLAATAQFYAVISNDCESVQTRVATITVRPLATPTMFTATARTATGDVILSWNSVADADHYVVERRSAGGAFLRHASPHGTTFTDVQVAADTTYVYRVIATSATEGAQSAPTQPDAATRMTFTELTPGSSVITAAVFHELLRAVNSVRAAAGSAPAAWSAIAPGLPPPAPGVPIRAEYVTGLRSAMNDARTQLGLQPLIYAFSGLKGRVVTVNYASEIVRGVE